MLVVSPLDVFFVVVPLERVDPVVPGVDGDDTRNRLMVPEAASSPTVPHVVAWIGASIGAGVAWG